MPADVALEVVFCHCPLGIPAAAGPGFQEPAGLAVSPDERGADVPAEDRCALMPLRARAGRGGGRWSVREFQLPLGKGRSDLKVVLEPVEVPGFPTTCRVVVRDQSVSVDVEDVMKVAKAISPAMASCAGKWPLTFVRTCQSGWQTKPPPGRSRQRRGRSSHARCGAHWPGMPDG